MNEGLQQYFKEHQIDDSVMYAWRLSMKSECLVIPIRNRKGEFAFNKYRHFGGKIKYSYDKGASMELFGAELITDDTRDIFIMEGELKAILMNESIGTTLNQKGPHHTVAVSSTGGARSFKEEWFDLFKGKDVHIFFDNDGAGNEGAMMLWSRLQKAPEILSIDVYALPEGYKDVNEYVDAEGGIVWNEVVPKHFNLFGINTPKKNERMKAIRRFFQDLNEREMTVLTAQERWFLGKMREIARNEYVANRKEPNEAVQEYAESLEAIKRIPITNFVKFRAGTAPCVFHSDRNPSMHYNDEHSGFPNTVKCYSCGKFGDVVDVVMAINSVGFVEALKILRGN